MLNNIINQTETETENVFNTYLGGGGGGGGTCPLCPLDLPMELLPFQLLLISSLRFKANG